MKTRRLRYTSGKTGSNGNGLSQRQAVSQRRADSKNGANKLRTLARRAIVAGALGLCLTSASCRTWPEEIPYRDRLEKTESPKSDHVRELSSVLRDAGADQSIIDSRVESSNRQAGETVQFQTNVARIFADLGMSGNEINGALIQLDDPADECSFSVEREPTRNEQRRLTRLLRRTEEVFGREGERSTSLIHAFRYDEGDNQLILASHIRCCENGQEPEELGFNQRRIIKLILESPVNSDARNGISDLVQDSSDEQLSLMYDTGVLFQKMGMSGDTIYAAWMQLRNPEPEKSFTYERELRGFENRGLGIILRRRAGSLVSDGHDGQFGHRYDHENKSLVITFNPESE